MGENKKGEILMKIHFKDGMVVDYDTPLSIEAVHNEIISLRKQGLKYLTLPDHNGNLFKGIIDINEIAYIEKMI